MRKMQPSMELQRKKPLLGNMPKMQKIKQNARNTTK